MIILYSSFLFKVKDPEIGNFNFIDCTENNTPHDINYSNITGRGR